MFRGSRKHVLDWTSRPTFGGELCELVAPIQVRVSASSLWTPRGYSAIEEARLEAFGPRAFPQNATWTALQRWWLAKEAGANTPNWDIAVACEVEGAPGLVLVEAKANVPELSSAGKRLDPLASGGSRLNHDRIGEAIGEACEALRRIDAGVNVSRDSHYQLSNRIAFAWKVAQLGVPTVLVYLGFTGDTGIADVGEPFRDAAHWAAVFAAHAHKLVPEGLFERRIDCGAAPAWFLVRARQVIEPSIVTTERNRDGVA